MSGREDDSSTIGPCSALVSERIAAVAGSLADRTAGEALTELARRLSEPLRVAITGRVNAGKSTIVNAMLTQRAAATDTSECTRHVTWFRHGVPERVEVVTTDGRRHPLRLRTDGRLPDRLGLTVDGHNDVTVERLEVFLSNDTLRDFTLIDTPGLASLDERNATAAPSLLAVDRASRYATAQADVVVFVATAELRASDAELIARFQRLMSVVAAAPTATMLVLNKADLLAGDSLDPVGAIDEQCQVVAASLRAHLGAATALVGLLAETTSAGVLTQADLDALRRAANVDSAERDRALMSPERFLRSDVVVDDPSTRERLLAALDLSGVRIALAGCDGTADSDDLMELLRERSGIDRLRDVIHQRFGVHADGLKAAVALAAIGRLAYGVTGADRDVLLELADELAIHPTLHRLDELVVLQRINSGELTVSTEVRAELIALLTPTDLSARLGYAVAPTSEHDRAEATHRAIQGAARWKTRANEAASSAERAAAQVAARSFELIWQALQVAPTS